MNTSLTDWYAVRNPELATSPTLLIYPDRVLYNIREAIRMAGDADRMRPHVKTHKMRTVSDMMLAEGITRFKCATIAEAEMLAQAGAPDVLLAYAAVGPTIDRLHQLQEAYADTEFSCLIDHPDAAKALAEAFTDRTLAVYVDLNVGMNRTGIKPGKAFDLIRYAQTLPGIRVVGLHAYDGHLRDTDLAERIRKADEAFAPVDTLRRQVLEHLGLDLLVVAGGTPTFPCHTRRTGVMTSPGTFVFWDAGYAAITPDQPFDWAAVVMTRVISIIDEQTLCLDLGHKAIAAENPLPRIVFLNEPDAQPIGQSEEHMVVRMADTSTCKPGDVWYGIPIHICPTVALYNSVFVVENGQVIGTWEVTARGRKLTI
ncbi:D-TA family PLP-dependent enzyme [Arsenicibacter rosenii]|uniref:Threonine aldolase n=1 Tax=Arsenicibacter rosenii TaxID=1750698 RepID=A0A1S2VI72_9BACT|nr:D-TA family PLP-dependent enzyme [Arsenicibacter rosenii]OIN58454.1 threonine aldolase [Arsenicibacter rosenii]